MDTDDIATLTPVSMDAVREDPIEHIDMAVFLKGQGVLRTDNAEELKRNIDLTKKWAEEGK